MLFRFKSLVLGSGGKPLTSLAFCPMFEGEIGSFLPMSVSLGGGKSLTSLAFSPMVVWGFGSVFGNIN